MSSVMRVELTKSEPFRLRHIKTKKGRPRLMCTSFGQGPLLGTKRKCRSSRHMSVVEE